MTRKPEQAHGKFSVLLVTASTDPAHSARRLSGTGAHAAAVVSCRPRDLARYARSEPPPHVLLVDESVVRSASGFRQLAEYMSKLWPQTRILMLGGGGFQSIIAAARGGAHGYIHRAATAEELSQTIRGAAAREEFALPHSLAARLRTLVSSWPTASEHALLLKDLTPRERQVIQLVAAGMTNLEVGNLLSMSVETARWHTKNALHKLGVRNRAELAARWRSRIVRVDLTGLGGAPGAC